VYYLKIFFQIFL